MRCRAVLVMMIAGIFPIIAWAENPQNDDNFNPYLYLAPGSNYSRMGKSLAQRYEPEMISMIGRIHREIKSDRFEMMDLNQSPAGGVGFWINPEILARDSRFLGVIAKVNIKLPYFPDSDAGRICDALDAFGKDLFIIIEETLDQIPDNSVKGAVVILIYSKSRLEDPNFMDQAEISVMFISREDLKKYNHHQLSLQKLFDRVDFYYFHTQDQIRFFFKYFLHG